MERKKQKLLKLVDELSWYHTIELGDDIVTKGYFDHRGLIGKYGIPENLSGKSVLDIGASSGFFSFEFEKRGAERVVAADVRWEDQDIAPVVEKDGFLNTSSSGILSSQKVHGFPMSSFEVAKALLGSKVEQIEMNAYQVSVERIGKFDVVFCGSLLLHLTDNFKVIQNIYDVTKECAVIATCISESFLEQPVALFLKNTSERVFWIPNMTCLKEMAKATGFQRVEEGERFDLVNRDGHVVHHGVIKCWK
jgi:tRNA (mo5U34)-methyltransferase